jgi:hypothetical protein
MRKFIPLLFLLFLVGCAHDPSWIPECRHTALLCATTAGEHYPTQIMVTEHETYGSPIYSDRYHAQAQMFYKGQWEFLRWDIDAGEVRLSDKEDAWSSIVGIYTPAEFMKFINQLQCPIPKEAKWQN